MKYHYGVIRQDGSISRSKRKIVKGTIKVSNYPKLGRIPCFHWLSIENHLWNDTKQRWEAREKMWEDNNFDNYYSERSKDVPKSFKAFNRHVQKLVKEYSFPKGTIIQLEGRFEGVGFFYIV